MPNCQVLNPKNGCFWTVWKHQGHRFLRVPSDKKRIERVSQVKGGMVDQKKYAKIVWAQQFPVIMYSHIYIYTHTHKQVRAISTSIHTWWYPQPSQNDRFREKTNQPQPGWLHSSNWCTYFCVTGWVVGWPTMITLYHSRGLWVYECISVSGFSAAEFPCCLGEESRLEHGEIHLEQLESRSNNPLDFKGGLFRLENISHPLL